MPATLFAPAIRRGRFVVRIRPASLRGSDVMSNMPYRAAVSPGVVSMAVATSWGEGDIVSKLHHVRMTKYAIAMNPAAAT